MEQRERNVFAWLDDIRDKLGMYLRGRSLTELESLICGYYSGLWVHGIVENVPSMNRHFLTWLYSRTRWSCCCGWAAAINARYPDRDEALAEFFKFADEYQQLEPTILCTVRLAARHKPTGKHLRYGVNGLMEKPLRNGCRSLLPGTTSLPSIPLPQPGRERGNIDDGGG